MSWIITGTQKLDPDAAVYIDRVGAVDGQSLEEGVKLAYNTFVSGCKTDGIWDAIKASCILAGARTLNGALVPLVGTAPTNPGNVFVEADYNRVTGLKGDASTKYLDSNAAHSLSPKNNGHCSVFASEIGSTSAPKFYLGVAVAGCVTNIATSSADNGWVIHDSGSVVPVFSDAGTGLKAIARSSSSDFVRRSQGVTTNVTRTSGVGTPGAETYTIYGRNAIYLASCRLSFYSIGESLDLALLDTRVTTLMSDLAAAIP